MNGAVECEDEDLEFHSKPCYVGKRMDIATIPQYLSEYDRGNDVEIWQIQYKNRTLI